MDHWTAIVCAFLIMVGLSGIGIDVNVITPDPDQTVCEARHG